MWKAWSFLKNCRSRTQNRGGEAQRCICRASASIVAEKESFIACILDSGISNHICEDMNSFTKMTDGAESYIATANGRVSYEHQGTVETTLDNRLRIQLSKAYLFESKGKKRSYCQFCTR